MMPSSQRYVCDLEMEKIYAGIGLAKKSVNSRGINFCLLRISVAHANSLDIFFINQYMTYWLIYKCMSCYVCDQKSYVCDACECRHKNGV